LTSRPPRTPRVESGRRRPIAYPSAAGPAVIAAVVVVVLVIVVGQLARRPATPATVPVPTRPSPGPQASVASSPIATPTATPTITPHVELASPWIEAPASPTPTSAAVPTPVARPTRTARPTPSLAACVRYAWSTLQTYDPPRAHVNVTIQVENHCGRELQPLELWFEVRGYRQGELVQVARGHPFDPVGTRFPGELTIGLPGSETWYDRITVEVLDTH